MRSRLVHCRQKLKNRNSDDRAHCWERPRGSRLLYLLPHDRQAAKSRRQIGSGVVYYAFFARARARR